MNDNEVLIEKTDKERLVELLDEANSILDKYPFYVGNKITMVTAMSRAKGFVRQARDWCGLLSTKETV